MLFDRAKTDTNCFDELYRYFLKDVYRFAYSLTNNQHDAEDLTSQTFIALYKSIDTFEWRNISLKYWLFRTVRNQWYTEHRKPQPVEYDDTQSYSSESEISFVDEIINKDLLEKVKIEIQKLSPIEQETITLRIWENMQFNEIAELQSEKEVTVKKRFYRSIEKLQKKMEERNLAAIVPLPFLFTAMKQVSTTSAYSHPAGLTNATIQLLMAQGTQGSGTPLLTSLKTFALSKAGIATIIATTGVMVIGGATGSYLLARNTPEVQKVVSSLKNFQNQNTESSPTDNKSNKAETTPTLQPTASITPSKPVTLEKYIDYSDEKLKLSLRYESEMEKWIAQGDNYYNIRISDNLSPNKASKLPYMSIDRSNYPQVNALPLDTDKDTYEKFTLSGQTMIKRTYDSSRNGRKSYTTHYYRFISPEVCIQQSKTRTAFDYEYYGKGCYDTFFVNDRAIDIVVFTDSLDYDFSKFDEIIQSIKLLP